MLLYLSPTAHESPRKMASLRRGVLDRYGVPQNLHEEVVRDFPSSMDLDSEQASHVWKYRTKEETML